MDSRPEMSDLARKVLENEMRRDKRRQRAGKKLPQTGMDDLYKGWRAWHYGIRNAKRSIAREKSA